MRNTKLYSAIIRLNGFELNRLHRFLVSPYFNQSQPIIQLFELLKEDIKKPGERELTKEEIWRSVMGEEAAYNDGRFRKLQSDLLNLIEEYYAQEAFELNPVQKAKYLLDSVFNLELDALQNSSIRTAHRYIEQQNYKPSSFYYFKYEIEQSKFYLSQRQNIRTEKSNIEDIAYNLDRFYLAEKLRYYCSILNHQHLVDINYQLLFIDEILEHVTKTDYSDTPPIVIYYTILQSYKEPDNENHYKNIKALINQWIHLFPPIEVAEILDSALNYCIKKTNQGKVEYIEEAFNLYQNWLNSNLLTLNGKMDPFHFRNIIFAALRLRKYDWTEQFIHKYKEYLAPQIRDNAITFNLAQLHFYKNEFGKVISLLSMVEYDDITYNLNSKTLLMASYYELDEIEALNSLLDTFRVYLSRNKNIPAIRRKHYLNTISIVRKLAKIAPGEVKEIARLEKEIESTQGIVSKNWILEKLAILKGETPPSS